MRHTLVVLVLAPSIALAQGVITTVAGTEWAFPGDGGPALEAPIGFVAKVTADNEGNVYGVDPDQHLAFKVGQDGILHVIAGHGIPGFSGDGGPARNAALRAPRGIALDKTGLIYISDTGNGRIRTVDADGIIRTIAGAGFRGLEDDGIQALDANSAIPMGLDRRSRRIDLFRFRGRESSETDRARRHDHDGGR